LFFKAGGLLAVVNNKDYWIYGLKKLEWCITFRLLALPDYILYAYRNHGNHISAPAAKR
jgi:hypothetical protein